MPGRSDESADDRPRRPTEAQASFHTPADLRVELVAAEPMVESPVAAAFLSPTRLLVVENRGYPTGPPPGQPPQGRVSLLTDTDGDGQFDIRGTFADELTFPNGVMPHRDGAIVTCAPDVLFLADRDGDGRAEVRQSLLTGFSTAGSTQLRVSHPVLGHDGWIYVCGGLTGGKVRRPDEPVDKALTVGRADVRFREVNGAVSYEKVDGGGQFGQSFDDFGRRFICYNRVQVQHVVLSSAILQRNKYLAFADSVQNCPADLVAEPLAGHGAAARIFPRSQNVTTADSHAGTFTAACGVTVFRGRGLGPGYRGVAFSCDPTANLVHADRLAPHGATFLARPLVDGAEVLASEDNWFRPVNLFHGPDGALYVCDMYRRTIEHPDYLPEEIRKRTDFDTGKNLGRIWRIAANEKSSTPDWSDDPTAEQLVSWLRQGDGWWQDEAARRMLESSDRRINDALRELLFDKQAPVEASTRALWLLASNIGIESHIVDSALTDSRPRVRETALSISDELAASVSLNVLKCAVDDDPRVRFSAALALHRAEQLGAVRAPQALGKIAVRSSDDRWTRAAVLSSLTGRERRFLEALLQELHASKRVHGAATSAAGLAELCYELGGMFGAQVDPRIWPELAVSVCTSHPRLTADGQMAFLSGVWDGLRRRGACDLVADRFRRSTTADDPLNRALSDLMANALRLPMSNEAPMHQRRLAVAYLSHDSYGVASDTLLDVLNPAQPTELQTAAIDALAMLHDVRVAETLLSAERFGSMTTAVRQRALQALLADPLYVPAVLEAIERGTVPAGVIDPLRRQQLSKHSVPEIAQRAAKLFAAVGGPERQQVYDDWKDVVGLSSSPANGHAVFRRLCTQCHRLDREGAAVGPDLFGIRNQPKLAILLHILIPEREITPGFAAYVAELRDGRTLTGLLTAETSGSVTLRQPQGKDEIIRRADIERLEASPLSLMPHDFDQLILRQEMADLLAYLKGER